VQRSRPAFLAYVPPLEPQATAPVLRRTMSVVAIAVIDRLGNPMYLRDFVAPLLFDLYVQSSAPDQPDNDFFCDSLVEETSKQHSEWPCRINYQFTIFAAHDKATQMLNGGWRGVGAVGPDACWMGLICCVNGLNAYGEFNSQDM